MAIQHRIQSVQAPRMIPDEHRAFTVKRSGETRCTPPATKNRVSELTISERRVLVCTALGLSTQDTAKRLGRSSETVKSQRESILRKLGARNMTHAITICFAPNLISRFS